MSLPGFAPVPIDTEVVTVLLPVFEDWESSRLLLEWLAKVLAQDSSSTAGGADRCRFRIVFVDDGSASACPPDLGQGLPPVVEEVGVLRLLRNLGHQRAIAIGLAWVAQHASTTAVIVMDADGEDKADDIPRLLHAARDDGWRHVIFAERSRRTEGLFFRAGYLAFRILHRLLTGSGIRYGNFSIIPHELLKRITVTSEIWNHYAAAVSRSRIPLKTLPTNRGRRLAGRSKMNLPSLVAHGLSALAVHADLIATRLLMMTSLVSALAILLILVAPLQHLLTHVPLPTWAGEISAFAVILLSQSLIMSVVVASVVLTSRSGASFIPRRDHPWFIDSYTSLQRPPLPNR
jgi:hypothetical protein